MLLDRFLSVYDELCILLDKTVSVQCELDNYRSVLLACMDVAARWASHPFLLEPRVIDYDKEKNVTTVNAKMLEGSDPKLTPALLTVRGRLQSNSLDKLYVCLEGTHDDGFRLLPMDSHLTIEFNGEDKSPSFHTYVAVKSNVQSSSMRR